MKIQQSKGFTLIELMVVVGIIGILLAIALPQYEKYQVRSAMANAFSTVDRVKIAYQQYRSDNGQNPDNTSVLPEIGAALAANNTITCSNYVKEIAIDSSNNIVMTFWTNGVAATSGCPTNGPSDTPAILSGQTITFIPVENAVGTTFAVQLSSLSSGLRPYLPKATPTS